MVKGQRSKVGSGTKFLDSYRPTFPTSGHGDLCGDQRGRGSGGWGGGKGRGGGEKGGEVVQVLEVAVPHCTRAALERC